MRMSSLSTWHPRRRVDMFSAQPPLATLIDAFSSLQHSVTNVMAQFYRASPPPLQHPVPTHPAYIPDPPSTPVSPQGYQRFTSSPAPSGPQQQQPPQQFLSPQFSSHVPAYTSPFQHSQQQQIHGQQPTMHQQQQHQGHIQQPDFAAWGMSDPTAQFGLQLGQSAVAAGQEYVQRNVRLFPSWSYGPSSSKSHEHSLVAYSQQRTSSTTSTYLIHM